jgi:hypothetical protein
MRLTLGDDGRSKGMAVRRALGILALGSLGIACASSLGPLGCGDAFSVAPDGGAAEASAPVAEAGADGGRRDAAADAGASWCATHGVGQTFCEDFAAGVPDQLVEVALNGTITADTADFETPPESMLASLPPLAPKGGAGTALGSVSFAKVAGNQIDVSAYLRVDAGCFPQTGSSNAISILSLDFPESNYQIVIDLLPTSVALIEVTTDADGGNAKTQEQDVQATGLTGSWQDWQLSVDGTGVGTGSLAAKNATLMVGNATLFTKATLKGAPTLMALQHPTLLVGVTARNEGSEATPACQVGVDDILADVRATAQPGH